MATEMTGDQLAAGQSVGSLVKVGRHLPALAAPRRVELDQVRDHVGAAVDTRGELVAGHLRRHGGPSPFTPGRGRGR